MENDYKKGGEISRRVDEHVRSSAHLDERVQKRVGAGHVTYGDTMRERARP